MCSLAAIRIVLIGSISRPTTQTVHQKTRFNRYPLKKVEKRLSSEEAIKMAQQELKTEQMAATATV